MKVAVIGANGQIGQKLVAMLKESTEHEVRAVVRKKEQAEALKKQNIEAVVADLEGPVSHIAEAVSGCEAIVFAAGSGGHTGLDKTLLIDLDGAVKAVEAAEQAGSNRFVMISALQANNRENWNEQIRPYYAAKHYADRMLEQSSLAYTIIRPGALVNESGTGLIEVSEKLERGSVSRADVAAVVYYALNEPHTFGRSFDLIAGSSTIQEALANI